MAMIKPMRPISLAKPARPKKKAGLLQQLVKPATKTQPAAPKAPQTTWSPQPNAVSLTFEGNQYDWGPGTNAFFDPSGGVVSGYSVVESQPGKYAIVGPAGILDVTQAGEIVNPSTGQVLGRVPAMQQASSSQAQSAPLPQPQQPQQSGGLIQQITNAINQVQWKPPQDAVPLTFEGNQYYWDPGTNTFLDATGNTVAGYSVVEPSPGQYQITGPAGALDVTKAGDIINPVTGQVLGNVPAMQPAQQPSQQASAPNSSQPWAPPSSYLPVQVNGNAYFIDPANNAIYDSAGVPVMGFSLFTGPNGEILVLDQAAGTVSQISNGTVVPYGGAPFSFDIPTDMFSTSQSTSTSTSQSKQGIDWSGPVASGLVGPIAQQVGLLSSLYPEAQATIGGLISDTTQSMKGMASSYADQLNKAARYAMRQALQDPGMLQGLLNSLAARNVLGSSVASDALASATRSALQEASTKAYQAAAQGMEKQLDVDKYLSGLGLEAQGLLADIAKVAPAAMSALAALDTVNTSTSQQAATSLTQDPLEPYKLMVQMFGLMQ
ncbi:MAG: hypothetical protein Q9M13_03385 [Mariprofundales bacterium]|nr:hypothetical protein [Mariprofundales bacterium]